MNRNVEAHFSELPKIDIERSMFDRSCSHKTSFNTGELIPFYVDEVLPGDTFNVKTSCVVRLQTPINPIMDNIYMDTYYFYVPCRILWEHWKQFMGESDNAWIPQTEYTIPSITPPANGWNIGTIADYMGIPTGVGPYSGSESNYKKISALPFRAYTLICDEFFRDQNLQDPLYMYWNDAAITGSNGSDQQADIVKGGKPFQVAKLHDYFSSCLPAPMKAEPVSIFGAGFNMGDNLSYYIPVVTGVNHANGSNIPIAFRTQSDSTSKYMTSNSVLAADGTNTRSVYGIVNQLAPSNFSPLNLWADLGSNLNINDLRIAFQLQKYYERNARSGSRYREILKAHFGITSSDARMQIPEYLGGHRFPLNIHQVASTSESFDNVSGEITTHIGDLGAMSNTADVNDDFIKSFEEHGYVIGVCCVRYDHSYPQGLERFWSRRTKLDYYWPVFSNIGEQPVFKQELMWNDSQTGYEVFGYQEAWAEYRYKPSRVSSELRPGVLNSLANWHLADYYENVPSLSASWIREDKTNVDRVLTVESELANQVFCDFYIKNICTRPMPMYSIPGLIDHH